ncbi:endonuclease/exonuclease/phosphatase family protein [Paenibacillus humicola]|uniref:endonuclease/exonuclease/phosphatase family protein n=1 Tax=Paenibacillus humicola TaxID=3110540 RepID=UPI00237B5D51|nr:endonuclease/exonuclease/phosphatase family protein [Paenibacillus humicola]
MKLNIMTFNLRNSRADDGAHAWPFRVKRVAETIRAYEPHIFGIQEGYLDMLEELQPLLSDYAWLGEGRDGGTEGEYCAIFYRKQEMEIVEQGQFWLSETPERKGSMGWDGACPRICTWAHFRLVREPGREIFVFNTHLDHVGQQAREQGALLIRQAMQRQAAGRPAVLMGDFNAAPDNSAVRFWSGEAEIGGERASMTDAYSALEGPPGRTYHDFRGGVDGEPIDYIFASEELKVTEVRVDRRTVDGGFPSDHYPVVAGIAID